MCSSRPYHTTTTIPQATAIQPGSRLQSDYSIVLDSCSTLPPATFLSFSRNVAGMFSSYVVLISLVSYLSFSWNVAVCASSLPSYDLEWNWRTAGLHFFLNFA